MRGRCRRIRSEILIGVWCFGASLAFADQEFPELEPVEKFRVVGKLADAEDISGGALVAEDTILVVGDEGGGGTILRIESKKERLVVTYRFPVEEKGEVELDAEGVALDGRDLYLVGSHGISRRTHEYQPSRYRVGKLHISDKGKPKSEIKFFSFSGALAASSLTAPFVNKPLQENGNNIEGFSLFKDHFYLGMRSPVLDSRAVVVVTNREGEFVWDFALPVPKGYGIRAIESFPGGLLLLLGGTAPDSDVDEFPSLVAHWDGKAKEISILGLLDETKGKPEAMIYLGEKKEKTEILIFSDDAKDGAPRSYRIPISGGLMKE